MATSKNDMGSMLGQLESTLDLYLVKKAPALPENIKDIIVKIAPWLTIIGVILAIPAILAVFGLGAILAPVGMMAGGVGYGINYILSVIVLAVSVVLEAMAIPGLFNREKGAWRKIYYAQLIGIVSNLLSFNIVGAIIGGLIGLYILFQVKSYYK